MQREKGGRDHSIHSGSKFGNFGSFGGFGLDRNMMSGIFGGQDPFDDLFFTRPFGSMFESSLLNSTASGDSPRISRSKGPVIEEMNTEDEEEGDNDVDSGEMMNETQRNIEANKNPLVEHPEDQADGERNKELSFRADYNKVEGLQPQSRGVSYQRVTYGGINGAYYTATMTRKTGDDGVVMEESKQADKTTGEAKHRISRGMHDKEPVFVGSTSKDKKDLPPYGHSLTKMLNSNGKVDIMQTLHNMNEDELSGFERSWKGNADRNLSDWNPGFDFHMSNAGGSSGSGPSRRGAWDGWLLPLIGGVGRAGDGAGDRNSSGEKPKKVVRINIE